MALEKRPRAGVRDIETAPSRGGGRPAGATYNPATGEAAPSTRPGDYDVFALDDPHAYRPERFYNGSTDKRGHGESIRIRIPQGIDSQLYAAVKEIPQYNSLQDLFRDAVIHRLEWLHRHYELSDAMRRFLELERMNADTQRGVDEGRTMEASVTDLDESLKEHYERGDWQLFANEMQEGAERAEWMREPYRGRTLVVLNKWRERGATHLAAREQERDREDR